MKTNKKPIRTKTSRKKADRLCPPVNKKPIRESKQSQNFWLNLFCKPLSSSVRKYGVCGVD